MRVLAVGLMAAAFVLAGPGTASAMEMEHHCDHTKGDHTKGDHMKDGHMKDGHMQGNTMKKAKASAHDHHAEPARQAMHHPQGKFKNAEQIPSTGKRHGKKHKCNHKDGLCTCPDGMCNMQGGCGISTCPPDNGFWLAMLDGPEADRLYEADDLPTSDASLIGAYPLVPPSGVSEKVYRPPTA